jgi:hypothetical protein
MVGGAQQLSTDPTAAVECHELDNRYIPLRVCDLVQALARDCSASGLDAVACEHFIERLRAAIELEACQRERELDDAYSFFNPDRDTLPAAAGDAGARTEDGYRQLFARLRQLLDKANFEPLSDVSVTHAIQLANTHGLRIQLDASRIEELSVFVRGSGSTQRKTRSWRAPLKVRTLEVPVYRRLVVIARLKNDPHVLIKMFKDIPEKDVDVLLPHASVSMGWLDRLFMMGGGAGVVGSTATQTFKILSAGLLAVSRLLWVLMVGAMMLMWRTFSGYRSARHKRDWQRTQHLYYHNLANNSAALHILLSMTAQEEMKEAVMAYLLSACTHTVRCESDLKTAAEKYLRDRFGVAVDFDVTDAVQTADRHGLWADRPALRALSLDAAIARLERAPNPNVASGAYAGRRGEPARAPAM